MLETRVTLMILNKQLSSEDNKVAEQIKAQMSSGLLQHENKSVIAPLELAVTNASWRL